MDNNEILSIRIDHTKPIELYSFTSSIICFESQYKRFLKERDLKKEEYKLYLNELKEGSKIVSFVKDKALKLFQDYIFEEFIKSFQEKIQNIIEQKIEQETGYSLLEIKEILGVFKLIANDYNAKCDISVTKGDQITYNYNFNGIQANAVTEECLRLITDKQSNTEYIENVILHWKQMSEDSKSVDIDKGIIEDIAPNKKVKIVCDDDIFKKQMITDNKLNPFNMFYLVDVEVKKINSIIVAYIIKKVHDKGTINND